MNCCTHSLTLLELQSHFGDNPVKFEVVCPQIGTAVLKGLTHLEPQSRFGGQSTQIPSRLSSKRDCGPKRVERILSAGRLIRQPYHTTAAIRTATTAPHQTTLTLTLLPRHERLTVSIININSTIILVILLRGTIVNRTCGTHKKTYPRILNFYYQQYLVLFTMVPRYTTYQGTRYISTLLVPQSHFGDNHLELDWVVLRTGLQS